MRRLSQTPAALAGFFALAGLVIGLAPFLSTSVDALPSVQGSGESSCADRDSLTGTLLSTRSITPTADIMLCETTGVSLTLRASCDAVPIYVMINIDISGSMIGRPIEDAKNAALAMVDALGMSDSTGTKVGMIVHGDPPRITLRMTENEGRVRGAINALSAGGEDNLPKSIDDARNELVRESRGEDPPPVTVMIVLSDGGQTYPPANAIGPARAARAAGIIVVSVCLDNGLGDCGAMRDVASEPRFFFRERDTSGLRRIFTEIAEEVRDINLRAVEVEETLPEGINYVPDSAIPAAEFDPADRTLKWTSSFVGREGLEVGYLVRATGVTTYTFAENVTSFRDTRDSIGLIEVPTAVLTVSSECPSAFTPTPTDTNTPTHTPTPTLTPTDTTTNTPTATDTPEPVLVPIYLPILNPWRCVESVRPADTVLLIDASTSMRGETASGRTKIDATKEGALAFIDLMRPGDRSAIFAFNDTVVRHASLTEDRAALVSAVEAIVTEPFTRIDLALDAAADELGSARHDSEHRPIVILMTDGLPSNTTAEAVREAAARANAVATIFAIGVGPDVDPALLSDVAGSPSRYFPADDADALAAIYREISELIPCESPTLRIPDRP